MTALFQSCDDVFGHALSGFRVERIAGRPDRPDNVLPPAVIERLAKTAHVHVDRPEIDVGIVRPDRVEQPLPRKDAAWILEEMTEQTEFSRAQGNGLAAATNSVDVPPGLARRMRPSRSSRKTTPVSATARSTG